MPSTSHKPGKPLVFGVDGHFVTVTCPHCGHQERFMDTKPPNIKRAATRMANHMNICAPGPVDDPEATANAELAALPKDAWVAG